MNAATEFSSDGPPTTDEATGETGNGADSPAVPDEGTTVPAPVAEPSPDVQVPAPAASGDSASDGSETAPPAPDGVAAASTGELEGEATSDHAAPGPVVPGADSSDAGPSLGALSDQALDELRALSDAATAGYMSVHCTPGSGAFISSSPDFGNHRGGYLAECCWHVDGSEKADADFVAACVNYVRSLLDGAA